MKNPVVRKERKVEYKNKTPEYQMDSKYMERPELKDFEKNHCGGTSGACQGD